jgi:hypothetical protein
VITWTSIALAFVVSADAAGPPVLRSATAAIAITSPTSCEVTLTLTVDNATEVEHRVEIVEGASLVLSEISGAAPAAEPRTIGRTRALFVAPQRPDYVLRYHVDQPADWAYRCPLWLPTTPTDGRSREVHITVSLPPGATPVGTMPAFAWSGREGSATLAHLPAFVRVPYSTPGQPAPWNIARLMDILTVFVLVAATGVWARRQRQRT